MPATNFVCLLAGARRMTARTFLVIGAAGIAVRLGFFWFLGTALHDPLETVLDWIGRYQWWLAGAFLLLTLVRSFRRAGAAAHQAATDEESG
jgi:membrane protein DedA with SNARE-associated domain